MTANGSPAPDLAQPRAYANREFVNEVGNQIGVGAAVGNDPTKLCRFYLHGPHSTVESYTTRMELQQLRDVLVELLGPPDRQAALTELAVETQRLEKAAPCLDCEHNDPRCPDCPNDFTPR